MSAPFDELPRDVVCKRSRCARLKSYVSFGGAMATLLILGDLQASDLSISKPIQHFGATDGSAAIACGGPYFVGATDENNVLRLYSVDEGSIGRALLDLNPLLGIKPKMKDGKEKFDECDLEGAARIGDRIYWIGSHGANSEGKPKKERQVLFATKVIGSGEGTKLEMTGTPYRNLLTDLVADHELDDFKLGEAAKNAPKEEGGLNIESLCAVGQTLYIGFRNPIPNGKALIVPLVNPSAVVDEGKPAEFGKPILLELGGLGLRDMAWWHDKLLLIGGDFRDRFDPKAQPSRLFLWKNCGGDVADLKIDFGDLNPEALVVFEDGRLLILSDDGARKVGDLTNKDLEESKQSFRSVWVQGGQ